MMLKSIFLKVFCSVIIGVILIVPVTVGLSDSSNHELVDAFSLKRLYLDAECFKIILYKPVGFIVHFGPVWFTSEHAYLAFIIEEEFLTDIESGDVIFLDILLEEKVSNLSKVLSISSGL